MRIGPYPRLRKRDVEVGADAWEEQRHANEEKGGQIPGGICPLCEGEGYCGAMPAIFAIFL